MPAAINLTGQKFNMLTAIRRVTGNCRWLFQCDCGNFIQTCASDVKSGRSSNCGCIRTLKTIERSTKHGMAGRDELYGTWCRMRARCNNPNVNDYQYYGGRGIKVCERWDDFTAFKDDMGPRPSPQHTIERKDNNGDYTPDNCCWATRKEQANNRG